MVARSIAGSLPDHLSGDGLSLLDMDQFLADSLLIGGLCGNLQSLAATRRVAFGIAVSDSLGSAMDTKRKDIHNSDIPVLCRSCEARHKGMCGVLDSAELSALSRHTRVVRHSAGEELAAESVPVDSYANVMRGVVKLTKVLEDGRQQIVGLQFAPDFLGRLFAPDSAVTAEAASDVDLCRVSKDGLERLIAENPKLEHRLMQQTLRELDEAREWMVTLGRKTAAEKVASFLYLIATQLDPSTDGGQKGRKFVLPLTRSDVADFLGLTIETVSRQLSKLRAEKIIAIIGVTNVEVPDLLRLKNRCG
jgi:CRP/FNR family transcriptional regulator